MDVSAYFYEDKVAIPSVARTEAGFYLETEPVDVFSVKDHDSIVRNICLRLETPESVISTPPRDVLNQNPPLMALAVGAKSWKDFFKSAELIKIVQDRSMFRFFKMQKTKAFSWKEPQDMKTAISDPAGLNIVWQKAASITSGTLENNHAT